MEQYTDIIVALAGLAITVLTPLAANYLYRLTGIKVSEADQRALAEALARAVPNAVLLSGSREAIAARVMAYLKKTSPEMIRRVSKGDGPIGERIRVEVERRIAQEAAMARKEAAAAAGREG